MRILQRMGFWPSKQEPEPEIMTIQQFCEQVDQAKNSPELRRLHEYLSTNARKYSLVNLQFMVEHLGKRIVEWREEQEFLAQLLNWLKK